MQRLFNAIENRNDPNHKDEELERLLKLPSCTINALDSFKSPPLHLAAMDCKLEKAKLLVKKGANVHIRDGRKNNVLHYAVVNSNEELIEYFISLGADVSEMCEDPQTPLHIAAENNDVQFAKKLLEQNARPEIKDYFYNNTPLHAAAENNSLDLARLLIDAGADIDAHKGGYIAPLIDI